LSDHSTTKLDFNKKRNNRKYSNNLRPNNTLQYDEWVIEEKREEIRKFLELNENENTTYQNLWEIAKAVLMGKFIAMNTYIKNTERSQVNDLMLHLKLLEKQEQAKPKTNKRREIIKIRAQINKLETKKAIQRINEAKVGSLKR
jgi:hypothetical protein